MCLSFSGGERAVMSTFSSVYARPGINELISPLQLRSFLCNTHNHSLHLVNAVCLSACLSVEVDIQLSIIPLKPTTNIHTVRTVTAKA